MSLVGQLTPAVAIPNGGTVQVLGYNARRKRIFFGAPDQAAFACYSTDQTDGRLGPIQIDWAFNSGVTYGYEDLGSLLYQPWFCYVNGANSNVRCIEVSE